jgi:hypothetical protein
VQSFYRGARVQGQYRPVRAGVSCAVVRYGVVGTTGVLWDVSRLCAVVPPPGRYGVVGTGLLWDVSTLCVGVPPPGRYGVVGTGVLWDVSTLCVGVPPAGLYGVVGAGELDVKHCVL